MSFFNFFGLSPATNLSDHTAFLIPYVVYKRNAYFLLQATKSQLEFVDHAEIKSSEEFDYNNWVLRSVNRLIQLLKPDAVSKVIHTEFTVLPNYMIQPNKVVTIVLFDWDIIEDAFDLFALNSDLFDNESIHMKWFCLRQISDPNSALKYHDQIPHRILNDTNFQIDSLRVILRTNISMLVQQTHTENDLNFEDENRYDHVHEDHHANAQSAMHHSDHSDHNDGHNQHVDYHSTEENHDNHNMDNNINNNSHECNYSNIHESSNHHSLNSHSSHSDGSHHINNVSSHSLDESLESDSSPSMHLATDDTGEMPPFRLPNAYLPPKTRRIQKIHNGNNKTNLRLPKSGNTLSKEFYDRFLG